MRRVVEEGLDDAAWIDPIREDDVVKIVGSRWMREAQDLSSWRSLGWAYAQQRASLADDDDNRFGRISLSAPSQIPLFIILRSNPHKL
jgi:hypothetical protein